MPTVSRVSTDEAPLLLGVLEIRAGGGGRPILICSCHCPVCRAYHDAEWPIDLDPTTSALLISAPCLTGPFAGRNVMLGLDPNRLVEHGQTTIAFAQALRNWLARRGPFSPPAVAGSIGPPPPARVVSLAKGSRTPRRPRKLKLFTLDHEGADAVI